MEFKCIVSEMTQENTYILSNNNKALIFDPGDPSDKVINYIKENDLTVEAILLTHGHYDHILGVKKILDNTNTKIYAGKNEKELLEDAEFNLSKRVGIPTAIKADYYLDDNEIIELADLKIKTIEIGEHTPGIVCFYIEDVNIIITGDTLFNNNVGRTDFHNGDEDAFVEKIYKKVLTLPKNTEVYPGHGFSSTIEKEINNNPYFEKYR